MSVADLHASEGRELARQAIDAIVDQKASVDLRRLTDDTAFQEMLALLAHSADERIERLTDARAIAPERDRLLQLPQFRSAAFRGLPRRQIVHLRSGPALFRRVDERPHMLERNTPH